jgi:proteic killer suppression protein
MSIKSFRHDGLRRLFFSYDVSGVPPSIVAKLRIILSLLDHSNSIQDFEHLRSIRVHIAMEESTCRATLFIEDTYRLLFSVVFSDHETGTSEKKIEITDLDLAN